MITTPEFIRRLIATASDFVGLVETKDNAVWDDPRTRDLDTEKNNVLRSAMEQFGWEAGEPYCAAFAGAVVYLTAKRSGLVTDKFLAIWTPHCMTNVRAFKKRNLLDDQPSDGCIMLMRHGQSDSGHAALVAHVDGVYPNRMLATIEGNTSATLVGSQRQGDGIYSRARNVRENGDLVTQGFVSAQTILSLLA